jgi:nicotinate-nucleotide pyrophosphorylase (carboxylating)
MQIDRIDQIDDIDFIIQRALAEDIGSGDVTTESTVSADATAAGLFRCKARGVVSGLPVAARVFSLLPGTVEVAWFVEEGQTVEEGSELGRISGNARSILTGERTALNILQRMSGIATAAARLVSAAGSSPAIILDTRKTAPGLRALDKMAVRSGGAQNHRWGLYDMVLIKDNHIAAAGGITEAISSVRRLLDQREELELVIEVEARTLEEVQEVIAHKKATGDPQRILLDNMVRRRDDGTVDTSLLVEALQMIDGRLETEASGNVTVETVAAIAETGVDFVSAGSITHSVMALDISLELELT